MNFKGGKMDYIQSLKKFICFRLKDNNSKVRCKNFQFCSQEHSEHIIQQYGGYCYNCATSVGPLKFKENKEECPICLEEKELVGVFCGRHEICISCWIRIIETDAKCPFCRKHLFDI